MTHSTARILVATGAFVAGLVLCVSIVLLVYGRPPVPSMPKAAAMGGPFTLTDQNGRTVTDKDFLGKPLLVFFGFTHCPDFCPTTMFEVAEIIRALGRDSDRVRALFITIDPERDTPEALKAYVSSFDPYISAATGDPETIAAVAKSYRAIYRKVPLAEGGYTMDHTIIVYLMGKDGRFITPFSLKRTTAQSAEELRKHI
jgi:protein SCO1/2